jgi:hypothetical protein
VNNDPSLVNYWPVVSGQVSDFIKGADLTSANPTMQTDRFNMLSQSFRVSNYTNYFSAPADVYFTGSDFTFTAWVKVYSCASWMRLIDFGNGPGSDNVLFLLSLSVNCDMAIWVNQASSWNTIITTPTLNTTLWTHVAFVYTSVNKMGYIYVNGLLSGSGSNAGPFSNIVRKNCFVGYSNWGVQDPATNAAYDEIRLYNRSLSQLEVKQDMNKTMSMFFTPLIL